MRSMTAFGIRSVSVQLDDQPPCELSWELRSVNHRYLDVSLRLPDGCLALETEVRRRIGGQLQRGKLEARLHWQDRSAADARLRLHEPTLQALAEAISTVREQLPAASVDALRLLAWPGVVATAERQVMSPALEAAALTALDAALADLVAQREREGQALAAVLGARASDILALLQQVHARLPEVRRMLRERQLARLAALAAPHDESRLEQELLHAAQRLDVDEELSRIEAHVEELRRSLASSDAVGRRLDFLMQEFNREANTLASKAADSVTSTLAVELKVLIEQMREQVQNIE